MKIVVRSHHQGRHIHGETFVQNNRKGKPYKVLFATVDFEERRRKHKDQLGCCRSRVGGRRVLELTESQFLDAHSGKWNLYHVGFRMDHRGRRPTHHEFFFLPENQNKIDVEAAVKYDGWKLWGSCQACILRMDLEPLLQPFLQERKHFGRVVSHAHVMVMMDRAEDKEYEFNRTNNNAKREGWGTKDPSSFSNRKSYNHKHRAYAKEESSCCSAETVTTATTDDSQDNYSDLYSCHSGPPPSFDEGESEHHSPRRGRSPVRPPRHVQCTLTDPVPVIDPVQILIQVGAMKQDDADVMADITSNTQQKPGCQPRSQFRGVVEPSNDDDIELVAAKGNCGNSYLAALTGAPSMAENFEPHHTTTTRLVLTGQPGSAEPLGWTTQQDFPALAESFHQMNVVDDVDTTKMFAKTMNSKMQMEMERVPPAA